MKDSLKKLESIYKRLPRSNATDDLGFFLSDIKEDSTAKLKIPTEDGFYWFYDSKEERSKPVEINKEKYGLSFKSFDGSTRSRIDEGDYFTKIPDWV